MQDFAGTLQDLAQRTIDRAEHPVGWNTATKNSCLPATATFFGKEIMRLRLGGSRTRLPGRRGAEEASVTSAKNYLSSDRLVSTGGDTEHRTLRCSKRDLS